MRAVVAALLLMMPGCSTITDFANISRRDAETAAMIAAEWGDEVGFDCFSRLAAHTIIAPVGPLSTIAAARAARLGQPTACAQVRLDARRRIVGWLP